MKATAIAPANIAFIKYWGKTNEDMRLPCNDSISMNLSGAYTTTTVEFSPAYSRDDIFYEEKTMDADESERVVKHLNRIRPLAGSKLSAKVVTKNSFPKGTGVASSSSGFAALTLAAVNSLKLKLSEKELTVLARLGSGSAARSIPDGFVAWKSAETSNESFAYSLYDANYWDLRDILVVVSDVKKKVSSTIGHENALSSIFFKTRQDNLPDRIKKLKDALKTKDFQIFGQTVEQEAVEMHTIMMTQDPPLFYWNGITMDIIHMVHEWRNEGLSVFFTIDAGPNMHLICEAKNENMLIKHINEIKGIKNIIINAPAVGARLTDKHLF